MSRIPSTLLVREHIALRAAGVKSFSVRQHMIQRMVWLAFLRANSFEAWVEARRRISVTELLQMESERGAREPQSSGKCAFWRALNKSRGAP